MKVAFLGRSKGKKLLLSGYSYVLPRISVFRHYTEFDATNTVLRSFFELRMIKQPKDMYHEANDPNHKIDLGT